MSVGQWFINADCWLALFILMRRVSFFKALVALWRIRALDWIGTMEKVLVLVLGGEEGTLGWSKCGVVLCGGEAGSILVGAATLACGVALTGRRVLLIGLSGGGECSLVVGMGAMTLFGCHSMSCGSSAAATMLCVWCSHESV